jgi:Ca-activated chloride channel family protein
VSFEQPLYLLGLLAVPLVVAGYLAHERRRRAAGEAFVRPSLRPSVAPTTPGWRRHLPPAAYAVALVVLLVALARPHATVAMPVEQASIVLVTDHSGSMQATDVAPSRLAAARDAAERFLVAVPDDIRVGLVAFNHGARTLQTPTVDRGPVRVALAGLRPAGGTATGDALAAALDALERQRAPDGERAPGAVVLLSDGESTRGRDPLRVAQRARRLAVPVYTVALGTDAGTIEVTLPSGEVQQRPVPPDRESLRRIAAITGGRAFSAQAAASLDAVYDELGSKVALRDERREITSAFAGGALALALAGGALSLHWFRRLP